jgi:hypothetical protein
MPNNLTQKTPRREIVERLAQARREQKEQEYRLAQLKYEWGIAKRMRNQARSEDEREKWRVQSDVCMGLILQQESLITEIKENIEHYRSMLAELNKGPAETDH